jgi:hypothetical protein
MAKRRRMPLTMIEIPIDLFNQGFARLAMRGTMNHV